jgi:hypothetical protein
MDVLIPIKNLVLCKIERSVPSYLTLRQDILIILYQFESMLKFIEWRFNIPPLTERDAHANNLLNAFDFSQKPRPTHIIPLSQAQLDAIKPYIRPAH